MVLCKKILWFQQVQKIKSSLPNFKKLNSFKTQDSLITKWLNSTNKTSQYTNHL
jgi:hypothetical protein